MEMYYDVKFKEEYDTDKGPKWRKDQWLVRAISPTDAEARAAKVLAGYGNNFEIYGATKSKYTKVVEDEN